MIKKYTFLDSFIKIPSNSFQMFNHHFHQNMEIQNIPQYPKDKKTFLNSPFSNSFKFLKQFFSQKFLLNSSIVSKSKIPNRKAKKNNNNKQNDLLH